MREPKTLIALLREMSQSESGAIANPDNDVLVHHLNLLTEVGFAVSRSEDSMEITNAGYDFLNGLDANPNNEQKWLDMLTRGDPIASATLQVSGFGGLDL